MIRYLGCLLRGHRMEHGDPRKVYTCRCGLYAYPIMHGSFRRYRQSFRQWLAAGRPSNAQREAA